MNRSWFVVLMLAGALLCSLGFTGSAHAAEDDVFGFWTEPGGSTIHVERCGDAVCAVLAGISKSEPYTTDGENPDPALRTRPLCGLRIGEGFHLQDAGKLEGGKLYDPKSGKTYQGSIEAKGNTLKLRGYVGAKIFGRTEIWSRATADKATCQAAKRS